ncbi:MAG: hypothetical protein P1V20_06850, partial [Verrucomicrobiales bacterium]|nr:hypothetical protein [Verrucomicrobiales bacterium]
MDCQSVRISSQSRTDETGYGYTGNISQTAPVGLPSRSRSMSIGTTRSRYYSIDLQSNERKSKRNER